MFSMSKPDIEKLKKLKAEADNGEWEIDMHPRGNATLYASDSRPIAQIRSDGIPDAQYIAALHNADLLAYVERLEGALKEIADRECSHTCDCGDIATKQLAEGGQ